MTDREVLEKIEFYAVLKRAADCAINAEAQDIILSVEPSADFDHAQTLLEETSEAYLILFERLVQPIERFDSIDVELNKCKIGSTLSAHELLKIGRLIDATQRAIERLSKIKDFDYPRINRYAGNLTSQKSLYEQITDVIDRGGEVKDSASPLLKKIRRGIENTKNLIKTKLESYIRSGATYLQDTIITIRNDRYVLPVKAEHKKDINGLLHDRSASGATVFIEPMPVVELNNQLRELIIDEAREVERILAELTQKVSEKSSELAINQVTLHSLDVIFARARYGESIRAIRPQLTKEPRFKIIGGRHPLIGADKVVPISIELSGGNKILVISGPNTGGKTVSLKTVGLFSAMAASGFYVPSLEGTVLKVFSSIYCVMGDNQSIEQSLSTYSSHIKCIIEIINNLSPSSLVLLDELAAGTDPSEGAALAVAIVKYLLSRDCFAIVTTHYTELKDFSVATQGVKNASMEFNPVTLLPTYKLIMDLPGSSNAIAIAEYLGLKKSIINEARKYLDPERRTFENILDYARKLKADAENEKLSAQAEREQIQKDLIEISRTKENISKELERINAQAERKVERIVSSRLSEADQLISNLEQLTKDAQLSGGELLKAKQLRSKFIKDLDSQKGGLDLSAEKPIPAEELKAGMKVEITALSKEGILKTLPDKKGRVMVDTGGVTLTVEASGLVYPREKKTQNKTVATVKIKSDNSDITTEINLLGKTVHEALYELDQAIDMALLNKVPVLKVIHGKGTGALRAAITAHLKKIKTIVSYSAGSLSEGGSGVTIIKFGQ